MIAKDLSLKVTDFLGIVKMRLKFDKPLTIIHGENGSAKSSALDAIRYVHGVTVRNTKANMRERLSHDEDLFDIEWICNKKKLKGTAASIPTVSSVEKAVGVSRKALAFCMDPAAFLLAGPKELKELFTEVLSLDMDWKKACVKRKCDNVLLGHLSSDIKSALREAKEARAECKGGKGEEPEKPEDPEVQAKGGTKHCSEINLQSLDNAIGDVKAAHEDLLRQHAVVTENQISEKIRIAARKEIKELEAQLQGSIDTTTLQAKLTETSEAKVKEEQKHRELVARRTAHVELQTEFKKWDLDFCGACTKKLERLILKEEGATDQLRKMITKSLEKIGHMTTKEDRVRGQIVEADTSDITKRIAGLQEAAAEPVSEEEIEKLETEAKVLEGRLADGQVLRDAVRDYSGEMEGYRVALDRYEKQGEKWGAWDLICKEIPIVEKAGVMAGLNPLRKIMAKLKILDGEVAISNDLELTYDGRSVDLLSKAERYIVSLAPYFATIELFKFPFVLVDDGDFIVTRSLRTKLQAVLMAIAKVKPVIFAQAQTAEDTARIAEKVKGSDTIALYRVFDGMAERVAG